MQGRKRLQVMRYNTKFLCANGCSHNVLHKITPLHWKKIVQKLLDVELFVSFRGYIYQITNTEFNITNLHVLKWIRVNNYIGFIKTLVVYLHQSFFRELFVMTCLGNVWDLGASKVNFFQLLWPMLKAAPYNWRNQVLCRRFLSKNSFPDDD